MKKSDFVISSRKFYDKSRVDGLHVVRYISSIFLIFIFNLTNDNKSLDFAFFFVHSLYSIYEYHNSLRYKEPLLPLVLSTITIYTVPFLVADSAILFPCFKIFLILPMFGVGGSIGGN